MDPRSHIRSVASEPNSSDELARLATLSCETFRRALEHDLDSPNPLFLTEDDSRIAIASAMHEALQARRRSVYDLHEKTGLDCTFLEEMLNGTGDISDSEPLQKIERALGVPLSHL